jgi:hypothetical protein
VTLEQALGCARIAIAGPPRAGKTTFAKAVADGRKVIHTDDFIENTTYAVIGETLVSAAAGLDRFVMEGVRVPQALRAGLVVDVVIWSATPKLLLSHGQAIMAKGTRTVFDEWLAMDGGRTPVLTV